MFLKHNISDIPPFRRNRFIFTLKLLIISLLIITFNQNIFLITNNAVYAEEITIPILTYHNFTKDEGSSYKINIVEFEKQMNYLAIHNYSVISLSELLAGLRAGQLPLKPIVITVDDGFKSTFTLAYPVLKNIISRQLSFYIPTSSKKIVTALPGKKLEK